MRRASCLGTLCRMNTMGIYLGVEKQEALLRGDTSNAVVNQCLVYGFQSIGMFFCRAPAESPAVVLSQARYAQRFYETLVDIYRTDNQRLKAQGVLFLAHAFVVMGFPIAPLFYLWKVCNLIDSGDLHFLPLYGRPPELSEQVREDAAVLSQAIYLENYLYLAFGGSVPVKTARIEREFWMDLQVRIVRCGLVVGLEGDLSIWPSECTHFCLIYAP